MKYYTNEGTNQKHRSPDKWKGNRQTPWKRIQNNDSKDDQKTFKKMEKMQESINKDLEEFKNKHTETNNTITEFKNTIEGINSRISEAEEQISGLEDKMVEITSEKQNKVKRMKRTEDHLRDLWDNIKRTSIWIIGVLEEEEKKKGYEKIFEETIFENFPKMEKEIVNQVQEAQNTIQDKHKEKHTKTHANQTSKD